MHKSPPAPSASAPSGLALSRRSPGTLLEAAEQALNASDLEAAKTLAAQATEHAEAVSDPLMHARAMTFLARVLYIRSEVAEGMGCVLRALELSKAVGDLISTARGHEVAARILLDVGETAAALEEGLAATEAAEACGDLEALGSAARAMANIYVAAAQWDKALEFGERFRETARLLRDPHMESVAIESVSFVHCMMAIEAGDRGDHERELALNRQAAELSREAMLLARACGNRRHEHTSVGNLAELMADIGRPQDGLDLLDSWPADPELDSPSQRIHHLETRGIVLAALGRKAEAVELLERSVAEAPTWQHEIAARKPLAALFEELGDLPGALEQWKRLFVLVGRQTSERAQRAASVAAVRLETAKAQAEAKALQSQAEALQRSNETLSRHSEQLRRQALEDPLTGLPNRRRLDELLAEGLERRSVVLLDVDHFKQVNDVHSHLVGDAVLRVLADLLLRSCRQHDTALRFGGEEFALLVEGTAADGVVAVAERARRAVEDHDWTALAPGLAVTASFGVALGAEADTSIELLALADRRLLHAKATGRNQVVGP